MANDDQGPAQRRTFVEKVTVCRLPMTQSPIPAGGGRIFSETGEIAQILNEQDSYSFLAYISFVPDSPRLRGNHYHGLMTETMYLIRGSLLARYRNLETGAEATLELTAGDLVTIAPNCAHVYLPLQETDALEIGKEIYHPDDTHPYPFKDFP